MAGSFRENFIKPFKRSPKWRKVRAEHLKTHTACQNCGKTVKYLRNYRMQVHHIYPVSRYPELELDPLNLITLCSNPRCHLDKGHLGDFKSYNPDVITDCETWWLKYRRRP